MANGCWSLSSSIVLYSPSDLGGARPEGYRETNKEGEGEGREGKEGRGGREREGKGRGGEGRGGEGKGRDI